MDKFLYYLGWFGISLSASCLFMYPLMYLTIGIPDWLTWKYLLVLPFSLTYCINMMRKAKYNMKRVE